MKITITMDVDPELVDTDHDSGLNAEGYDGIFDALQEFGSDIAITRGTG